MNSNDMLGYEPLTESEIREMGTVELKRRLSELEAEYSIYDANQIGIKLAINSIYGAFLNKHFYFQSYGIGESITGIGRYLTQSTENIINKYFREMWPIDTKLHNKLGITNVKPIVTPVSVYCDTDSIYFALDEVYANCEGYKHRNDTEYGGTKFALDIYNYRLKRYLDTYFKKLTSKYKGDNLLNLELEKISRSAVFLSKKKYALDISWTEGKDGGIFHDSGTYISKSGGEIVQSGTPKFIKDKLNEMVLYLLKQKSTHSKDFNLNDVIEKVMLIKDEFSIMDRDKLARTVNVNNYEKYVITDNTTLSLKKGTPWGVRAAAYYNHMLNSKHQHLKNKYPLIKSGDLMKYYCIPETTPRFTMFGYIPNNFPSEFAPNLDIEAHFEYVFLNPLNRYIKAIGQNPIDSSVTGTVLLF